LSPPKEELDSRLRGNDENQKEGSTRQAFRKETMHHCVIPAKAGIQLFQSKTWTPAFAGVTNEGKESRRGAFRKRGIPLFLVTPAQAGVQRFFDRARQKKNWTPARRPKGGSS
jgi:hypothetical protein